MNNCIINATLIARSDGRVTLRYYVYVVDVHDKATRSYNMSMIRCANTKPEREVRSALHRRGFRFRINVKDLPGKPDIVLPKYRKVIFVHGCFWHQHRHCEKSHLPKSRISFWSQKLSANVARDVRNRTALRALGWKPITIWECELTDSKKAFQRLVSAITEL